MCGIATITIGKTSRGRIPYHLLRKLTQNLLEELEARGSDASGIAVINEGGPNKSAVYKKPLRSSRLIVRPKFKEMLARIDEHTNFILLHARAATVSSNVDNYNNHPIVAGNIIGVHNGTLTNHEEVCKKLELPRIGSVDSEILFRIIQKYIDEGHGPQTSVYKAADKLEGAYTAAAVDMRHPYRMMTFRHERPLSVISIPHYDVAVTVSESYMYENAAEKAGIKAKRSIQMMKERTGAIVDLSIDGKAIFSAPFYIPAFLGVSRFFNGAGYRMIDRRGLRAIER